MIQFILGRRWITHLLLILGSIVMLYPLLWMLSSSFKPQALIFRDLGLLPGQFTLENYIQGWDALNKPFIQFFLNSFVICMINVIGTVLSCSVTAYAFARLNFRLKRIWFALMVGTILLPSQVTLIPRYVMFFQMDWINTYYPLTVPAFFATNAFFVFLNIQFIRGIPRELDEAAEVDGASRAQIFSYVIFPLSLPALITTGIFTFIWTWDDFFSSLLYISSVDLYTASLALRNFSDVSSSSSYGSLFAMSILSLIPIFIIFVLAQRYLVQGISTTGFKG